MVPQEAGKKMNFRKNDVNMKKYDFDGIVSRRNTSSYKWDSSDNPDVLPMWVADMDFRTAPAITEALKKRVEHGVFGYTRVPDSYYESVIGWFGRRHGWTISRDWIIYTPGVIPALSATIKALASPGDKVLVQTPVYNCFFSSIRNNGCIVETSPLMPDGNSWRMDFEDLERKTADPAVKLFLLCSPHNPVGRVWTEEELRRAGEICLKNGVIVLSDEIHCELVYPGHVHIPFASLSDDFRNNSVTFISPSKAFNIAGLQIADIVAPDESMRRRIDRAVNINEVCDVNPFGVLATEAAYGEGEEWLDSLIAYLRENYLFMKEFCKAYLPEFPLSELEGTYLVWMDCSRLGMASEALEEALVSEAKLWLNAGTMYGEDGEGYMRWNIACPRSVMLEGLERFTRFVRSRTAL